MYDIKYSNTLSITHYEIIVHKYIISIRIHFTYYILPYIKNNKYIFKELYFNLLNY